MKSLRHDDPEYCERHNLKSPDPFKGQRLPVYGLIMSLINLGLGEPSLLRRSQAGTGRFVCYLAYQVPCTLAVPAVPVGLALLLGN